MYRVSYSVRILTTRGLETNYYVKDIAAPSHHMAGAIAQTIAGDVRILSVVKI